MTKQRVSISTLSFQSRPQSGRAEASRVSSPCWASKEVSSSPSPSPRWLLSGTQQHQTNKYGGFDVVTQKNQLLPNKSWKRLQRWFRPRSCVASKQKHSCKHRVRQQACCDNSQQQCSRRWQWGSLDSSCKSNQEFLRWLLLPLSWSHFASLPTDRAGWWFIPPQRASRSHPFLLLN